MLNFVNHKRYLQKMQAYRLLFHQKVSAGGALDGLTERQVKDVTWRAKYVRLAVDFWDMTRANLPIQITDKSPGASRATDPLPTGNTRQAISDHAEFKNSMLVNSHLRAFHRSDGRLLFHFNPPCC